MNNQAIPGGPAVPAGFSVAREGERFRIARAGLEEGLKDLMAKSLRDLRSMAGAARVPAGRAEPVSVPLPDRLLPGWKRVLVRPYSHGGILRRVRGRTFLGPGRALRELAVNHAALRRELPVPPQFGLTLHRRGALRWRMEAWIGWIPGAVPFSAALRDRSMRPARKRRLLDAAAAAIRRCHDGGLLHHDLNSRNVVVRREGENWRAWLIDLDRARLVPRLPVRARIGQIARLFRSLAKEEVVPGHLSGPESAEFARVSSGGAVSGAKLDRFLAGCRRTAFWHGLLWSRPSASRRAPRRLHAR